VQNVHECKQQGFVLKMDYEKDYDKVNCRFLLDILEERGFGKKWLEWINQIQALVTITNMDGELFQTGKGLRQGIFVTCSF
jgi:hypothetical protein